MAYGWRVTYERVYQGRRDTSVIGVKGSRSHALSAARIRPGFIEVSEIVPLSAEQYAQEFPVRRSQKGRHQLVRNYA